ncbi:MAG: hypothetical protein HN904_06455 [Victivallales bacterium]|jgi:hypothetical protein|nr:hypothetical protein [Victivallales bacterium]
MKTPTEQDLARHLLVHRRNGYSAGYVLRKSVRRYAVLVGILALFVIWFHATDGLWYKGLCLWSIGMFVGALARDVGWLLRIKAQWPFTAKVVDWQKVEDLAEGRDPASS